jgi:hypothetical protein
MTGEPVTPLPENSGQNDVNREHCSATGWELHRLVRQPRLYLPAKDHGNTTHGQRRKAMMPARAVLRDFRAAMRGEPVTCLTLPPFAPGWLLYPDVRHVAAIAGHPDTSDT